MNNQDNQEYNNEQKSSPPTIDFEIIDINEKSNEPVIAEKKEGKAILWIIFAILLLFIIFLPQISRLIEQYMPF